MEAQEYYRRWGEARFVKLDPGVQDEIDLPIADKKFLTEIGLPHETGCYDIVFDFPSDHIPTLSTIYRGKQPLPLDYRQHLVLGGNDSTWICVDIQRQHIVISVDKFFSSEPAFINSSIAQMAETFLVLREAIPLIETAEDDVGSTIARNVGIIDPRVLTDGGGWWLLMIEEI